MHPQTPPTPAEGSVLSALRALLPNRGLRFHEALHIVERQAELLRALRGYDDVPVPVEIIKGLPRLRIEHDHDLPGHAASGVSYWHNQQRCWVIGLNPKEPRTRQRFSALHEYAHIIWHYHPGICRIALPTTQPDPAEELADYFAACVLMPKHLIKSAYYDGIQRISDLAELFDVSKGAITVRLAQLGITDQDDNQFAAGPPERYRLQQSTGVQV